MMKVYLRIVAKTYLIISNDVDVNNYRLIIGKISMLDRSNRKRTNNFDKKTREVREESAQERGRKWEKSKRRNDWI